MSSKFIKSVKALFDEIKNAVFVKKCVACKVLLPYDHDGYLCDDCADDWGDAKREICPKCHKEQIKCRCSLGKKYVDSVRNLALYSHGENDWVTNRLVYSMKRSNNDDVFLFLANEIVLNISPKKYLDNTVVVSVPRSPKSVRKYGYDHAKKLAKRVADILSVEYVDIMMHRGGKDEQKTLKSLQREINARNNCYIKKSLIKKINGKNILLVDDIVTTGAMTGICAELLKKNGAKRVDCLVVAKNKLN